MPANLDWKSYNEMISYEVSGTVLYVSHQIINTMKKNPYFRITSSNYVLIPQTKLLKVKYWQKRRYLTVLEELRKLQECSDPEDAKSAPT